MSKDNLSDYFAKARDLAGIIPPAGKTPPTFHEQRSLSERLYRAQGIDTKTLLGHKVQATKKLNKFKILKVLHLMNKKVELE